jgi:hypothetical protein
MSGARGKTIASMGATVRYPTQEEQLERLRMESEVKAEAYLAIQAGHIRELVKALDDGCDPEQWEAPKLVEGTGATIRHKETRREYNITVTEAF